MAGFGWPLVSMTLPVSVARVQVTDTCRVRKNQVVPAGKSGAGATGAWNWVLWRRLCGDLGLVTGLQ